MSAILLRPGKFEKGNKPPEIIAEHFDKIAVDVVGPVVKSKCGYRFILTTIDLATSFVFHYKTVSCKGKSHPKVIV